MVVTATNTKYKSNVWVIDCTIMPSWRVFGNGITRQRDDNSQQFLFGGPLYLYEYMIRIAILLFPRNSDEFQFEILNRIAR